MPAPAKGSRLGGSPAHQRLILANLATQLFDNDRITTTEAKAKRLRPHAERLVTIAKKGDLAAIRRIARTIKNKGVANKLITEIAPEMAGRAGGYTRIIKIGFRKGDSAPMAVIELVKEPVSKRKTIKRKMQKKHEKAETSAKDSVGENEKSETEATQRDAEEPEAEASDSKSEETLESGGEKVEEE